METVAPVRPSTAARTALRLGFPHTTIGRTGGLVLATVGLGAIALLSLGIGTAELDLAAVIAAFAHPDGSTAQRIVTELRLPRTLVGLAVGAALALSGTVMQGVTRNPLADPGFLGINMGASLAVAIGITLGAASASSYVWLAIVGAAVASVAVFALGSVGRGRPSPIRLALAGAVIGALCASLTSAILILNDATLDRYRFWDVGSIAGRDLSILSTVLPFMVVGGVLAIALGRALNGLALGDDVARSLGGRVWLTRAVAGTSIALLAGAAVAAAGPIAFAGLAVPHAARLISGPDYRWILVWSLVLGPALLLGADVIGRVVVRPSELEVGIVTALIGAPVLVWLVRRRGTVTV